MKTPINDGGPAFPWCGDLNDCPTINLGMSLRDYFATKAMQAYFSDGSGYSKSEDAAAWAYEMADTMIKARSA